MSEELTSSHDEVVMVPVEGDKDMSIVTDDALLGVYGEIMDNLRSDREQVSELVDTFSNMVFNDGDSSTHSRPHDKNKAQAARYLSAVDGKGQGKERKHNKHIRLKRHKQKVANGADTEGEDR